MSSARAATPWVAITPTAMSCRIRRMFIAAPSRRAAAGIERATPGAGECPAAEATGDRRARLAVHVRGVALLDRVDDAVAAAMAFVLRIARRAGRITEARPVDQLGTPPVVEAALEAIGDGCLRRARADRQITGLRPFLAGLAVHARLVRIDEEVHQPGGVILQRVELERPPLAGAVDRIGRGTISEAVGIRRAGHAGLLIHGRNARFGHWIVTEAAPLLTLLPAGLAAGAVTVLEALRAGGDRTAADGPGARPDVAVRPGLGVLGLVAADRVAARRDGRRRADVRLETMARRGGDGAPGVVHDRRQQIDVLGDVLLDDGVGAGRRQP